MKTSELVQMAEDYFRASAHEYPNVWVCLSQTREDGYVDWFIAFTKNKTINLSMYGIDSLEGRLTKSICRKWLSALPETAFVKYKIDDKSGVAISYNEVPL